MPTGYTAKLHDGDQSFEDYLIGCAHAFGALIELRDDGLEAPIPDRFDPSPYALEALEQAVTKLAEAEAWTDEQAAEMAVADWRRAMNAFEEYSQRAAGINVRYRAMLAQVDVWVPPSEEHEGLKRFMREQIETCLSEGNTDHYPIPVLVDGPTYKANAIERANRDIAYSTQRWEEAQQRAAERTEWVRLLLESITASK